MSGTTRHLPTSPDPLAADCCCSRLSAVQRRVIDKNAPVFWHAGYSDGYSAGLDAAREAVERVSSLFQPLGPALVAIDALKEKS